MSSLFTRLIERFAGCVTGRRSETAVDPLCVLLVTKSECGLCDEMKAEIRRAVTDVPFLLEEVDLNSDPELEGRYALSVPVLIIEGRPAFKGRLSAEGFAKKLRQRARERVTSVHGAGGTGR